MKRHEGLGLSWACSHGQHALDEHDPDMGQHDRGNSGRAHMLGTVGGACTGTSMRRNAMGMNVRVGEIAICKERKKRTGRK